MSARIKTYLLFLLMALVWMRAVFGEFAVIDDLGLIKHLQNLKQIDFSRLFFGSRTGGLYYRPLLISSYYLETLFGLLDPAVMRLHNVLLHAANAFWLYAILGKVQALRRRPAGWWPFGGALLFGLHPLATESVNWVSGRTDLLAGFFVLASTWCLLSYRVKPSRSLLILAFVGAFCAMLSKEVAIAFFPGLFLLLWARLGTEASPGAKPLRSHHRLIGMILCLALALLAIIGLRSLLISSNMAGISRSLGMLENNPVFNGMLFFRLFGFYFKKMLLPWPLNFAIDGVDPLYDLLGVVVVVLLLWCFLRNRLASDFFVIAALLLLPAYPVSLGQVAWTPYAERYAYVASAFFILGLFTVVGDHLRTRLPTPVWGLLLVVSALIFGGTTFARNGLWQSNLTLWADTVGKNPDSVYAHTNYAATLFKRGDYLGAEREFKRAQSGDDFNYLPKFGNNYGLFLEQTGRPAEAVAAYREVLRKTKGKSAAALECLVTLCTRSSTLTATCGGPALVAADAERLYALSSQPRWLVKSAELFAEAGDRSQALALYRQAEEALAPTDQLLAVVKERCADLGGQD